jgi:hypothetical protein
MSRGPGKVQRAIREWLEEFPGLVHDIGELACHAYPIDGGKVEKKHRVAIIRALENMPLGDWIITYAREDHNELTIWNRADARSRAWMRCDKSERDAGEGTIHVANMIRAIRATNAYLAETGRSPFNMNATVEAAQSCQAARARMPPPDVLRVITQDWTNLPSCWNWRNSRLGTRTLSRQPSGIGANSPNPPPPWRRPG